MPLELLQTSPEIQVVTLNPARTFFAGPGVAELVGTWRKTASYPCDNA